jgi:polyisoprenyl-phosphate glycosyltransferase
MADMAVPSRTIELVVPVLNEEDNLTDFYDEVERVFAKELPHFAWRVLFIDDGSRDDSWTVMQMLAAAHENVRAIRLNRNHGSHLAISAGLAYSDADAVIVLAADLQDPPTVLPEFVRRWEEGSKVVWGVRAARHEAARRKVLSTLFHGLVRRYALPTYPAQGTGSFCLIDRIVVQNVRRMGENFRTIFGLVSIQGYPAAEVLYTREGRTHGQSGWSLHRMIRTTIDVFTSYSHFPVRLITWVGIVTSVFAFTAIVYQVIRYFVAAQATLRGWTTLFAAVCFFGGIQTLALGVLGEYIWRTFHEVKRRPLWYVDAATFRLDSP